MTEINNTSLLHGAIVSDGRFTGLEHGGVIVIDSKIEGSSSDRNLICQKSATQPVSEREPSVGGLRLAQSSQNITVADKIMQMKEQEN